MNDTSRPESLARSPYSPPSSSPAPPHRRPDSLEGRFGETWRRLFERPWLLLAAYLTIQLPINLLSAYLERFHIDPESIYASLRLQRGLDIFFGSLATAALIIAAAPQGHGKRVGEVLAEGTRAWLDMITSRILAGLAMLIGLIFLILPGIYVATRLSLSDYVASLEGQGGSAALKRSWELSHRRFVFLLCANLLGYALPILAILVAAMAQVLLIEFVPALDHLIFDWLFGIFSSGALIFSIIYMQSVYEDLVRENAATAVEPPAEAPTS